MSVFLQKKIIAKTLFLIALSILGSSIATEFYVRPAFGQTNALVSVSPGNISDFSALPGSNVTFQVNLANSPSISGFLVLLTFNRSLIDVAQNSAQNPLVDYSNNVLANTGASTIVSTECVDSQPVFNPAFVCTEVSATYGSILLGIAILGRTATAAPTNGLLFSATFNVKGLGLAQLHLNSVVLANGLTGSQPPFSTSDGYFTNIYCPSQGVTYCTPPIASFTTPAPPLFIGDSVLFSGSLSQGTNSGSSIVSYSWDWGESALGAFGAETTNPVSSHVYLISGDHDVTLRVKDSFGINGEITKRITILIPPPKPGFEVSAVNPPQGVYILKPGQSATVPITIRSLNGFSGVVSLTTSDFESILFPPSRIFVAPHSISLSLKPGGINDTSLVVTAPSNATISSNHTVSVIATSGSVQNSTYFFVSVAVPEIHLSCFAPYFDPDGYCYDLYLSPGKSISLPVYVYGIDGFSGGEVALSVDARSFVGGLTMTLSSTNFKLAANQTKIVIVTISVSFQSPLGLHFIQIDAQSPGILSGRLGFLAWVYAQPPPDFSMSAPSSAKLIRGNSVSFDVAVNSISGFSGISFLESITVFPSIEGQFSVTANLSRFVLPKGGSNSTVITISCIPSTPSGEYSVIILVGAYDGYLVREHEVILRLHVHSPCKAQATARSS